MPCRETGKGAGAGMDDYISKPVKKEVIFEMTQKYGIHKEGS